MTSFEILMTAHREPEPRWGRSNNCGACGTRRVTVDDIRRWTGARYADEVYGPEFFEYDGVI